MNDKYNDSSIKYLEDHKGKIFETAKYIAERSNGDISVKYAELESEYRNQNGTFHKELIANKNVPLKHVLDEIRHLEVETVVYYGMINGKFIKLFSEKGTQFSSNINMPKLIAMVAFYQCDFYIAHNHPFVFRASPSLADMNAIKEIMKMTIELAKEGINVNMLDFAIVTDFDYWSVMQAMV